MQVHADKRLVSRGGDEATFQEHLVTDVQVPFPCSCSQNSRSTRDVSPSAHENNSQHQPLSIGIME